MCHPITSWEDLESCNSSFVLEGLCVTFFMDEKHSAGCVVHYSLEGTGLNLLGYNIDNNKCVVIHNLPHSVNICQNNIRKRWLLFFYIAFFMN